MIAARLAPVYAHIAGFIHSGEINAAGLAIGVRGAQVAQWYGGDAAPGLPASPNTLWPLASISKLYTAAAMALIERGVLTLAIPVHTVLPAFSNDGRAAITLRHLLTHTSGLVYESPEMETRLRDHTPLDAIIDEATAYPLKFAPGTRLSYSDYGYAVVGRLAATAAGMPFPDLVRSLVLDPAGLADTFLPLPTDQRYRLARVVGEIGHGTDSAMYGSPYALGLAHPAFGVSASARDLLRFGLLFAPGGLCGPFSHAAVRTMTTDQTGSGLAGDIEGSPVAAPQPWGIGFMIRGPHDMAGDFPDLLPPGGFGHLGASGCALLVDPTEGIVIALVTTHHLRTGFPRWRYRINSTVNRVLAALT